MIIFYLYYALIFFTFFLGNDVYTQQSFCTTCKDYSANISSYAEKNKLWKELEQLKPEQEKPITVIIMSYNNKVWYKRNLASVFSQNYTNYKIIYVDDASPDDTGNLVEQFIKETNKEQTVTLIKNETRKGAMENLYYASHQCPDENIIVNLDGDDWLAHPNVFALLNKVYTFNDVWMTYGQYNAFYQKFPDFENKANFLFTSQVLEGKKRNGYRWFTIHLRTFYAWLFKLINKNDFCHYNHPTHKNNFLTSSYDVACMLPMIEMAGKRSIYIPDILYKYNRITPLNDDKVDFSNQREAARFIFSKKQYQRLENKPDLKNLILDKEYSHD